MFCKNCGKEVSDRAISCPKCGEPFVNQRFSYELREPKECSVAWVLWFFFGGFGVHCFYLKHYGRGFGYIGLFLALPIAIFGICWQFGVIIWFLYLILWIYDATQINKWVRSCNNN
jgi:hypothetical protein